jgi:multiple sugar transport system permease protein
MIGRSRWTGYALLAPALVAVGFLILYPLYLVVAISFRQGKTLNVLRLSELPLGLANYRAMLASDATWHSVGVTVAYLIGTIGPAFLIGLGTALLLNRVFPGRRWLRSLILLPWAVPGVIVSIVFLWMLDGSFGVVNALLRQADSDRPGLVRQRTPLVAVIVPTVWKYPFFALTLLAALQAIPANLYEAAQVDDELAAFPLHHVARHTCLGHACDNPEYAGRCANSTSSISPPAAADRATERWVGIYQEVRVLSHGDGVRVGVRTMAMAVLLVLLSMRTLRREYF